MREFIMADLGRQEVSDVAKPAKAFLCMTENTD